MFQIARRMTLRQRLLALVAVAIIPAGLGLAYLIAEGHREREREIRDQVQRTSQIVALEMERIVTGAESVLRTLAVTPDVRSAECSAFLARVEAALPQIVGFAVLRVDGMPTCTAGLIGAAAFGDRPWFAEALSRGGFAVGGYTEGGGGAYLPVAISTDDPEPVVLVTAIDLGWLGARLRERNFAEGSVLAVADRDGVIIAREPNPEPFVGKSISEANMPLVRAERPGTAEVASPDGLRRIVGFQPPASNGLGLYVAAGVSTIAAFAPVNAATWRTLTVAAAGAVAACIVAWLVGDRLFRQPIRRILATIASWRAGDESARTGIAPDASELSELAGAIDAYMEDLTAVKADRAADEERRTLLLREMNHRIKNLLAAVQAIANQTFRDRATPDSLRVFGNRLAAMAAAHDLLVTEHWESADLRQTVAAALTPFGSDQGHRFAVEGPPLQITARAALSLSMALHELCTNAAKYGALSVPSGRVSVRWDLRQEDGVQRFRFAWVESGGPPVGPPEREGFGTRLIEAALATDLAGAADLDFAAAGVIFTFEAEADSVLVRTRRSRAESAA